MLDEMLQRNTSKFCIFLEVLTALKNCFDIQDEKNYLKMSKLLNDEKLIVHRAAEKIYKSMICFVCFQLFICIETMFRHHILVQIQGTHSIKQEKKVFPYWSFTIHSSEIRGLRSTKCSSETLQNLLYFMYKKTHVVFFRFSFRATLYFYLMNALVYVKIQQILKRFAGTFCLAQTSYF